MNNLPNILTFSRILIIPLIIMCLYFEDSVIAHQLAALLFLIAGITDFLDGYLARIWHSQSNLGKFLDPIADKLLVSSIVVSLVNLERVDLFPALAIICREILVSGLREFLAEIRISVPVSKLAKVKTFVQIISLFILLLGNKGSNIMIADFLGRLSLWLAAILTIITGYAYLKASFKHFDSDLNDNK